MANKNKNLAKRLEEANKFPKEEYEKLKKERIVLLRRLNTAETERSKLSSSTISLKAKLAVYIKKKKAEAARQLELAKLHNCEKEIVSVDMSKKLQNFTAEFEAIVTEFSKQKESKEQNKENGNAVNDMKKIFALLNELKVDPKNVKLKDDLMPKNDDNKQKESSAKDIGTKILILMLLHKITKKLY